MGSRVLSIIFFIISWLSVFVIGRKNMKRYAPVGLFSALIVTMVQIIGTRFNWWRFKKPFLPWIKSFDILYNLGPFFIGTIGVFSLTSKLGFRVYFLVNLIIDSLFSFLLLPFLEKIGWIHIIKFTRAGITAIMLSIALVIYPFQKWQDQKFNKKRFFFWKL